jgi:HEAT repeat protein
VRVARTWRLSTARCRAQPADEDRSHDPGAEDDRDAKTRIGLAAGPGTLASAAYSQSDPEKLRTAKALFFDRKYTEARKAWQDILVSSTGLQADQAAYWIARSSENLGESERALKEYGDFLAKHPQDRALAEEARTSRIGLAARLYKAGARQHLPLLESALTDSSKTVRYFAALQLADLGPEVGKKAVPVLKRILEEEKDPDLRERAKLGLLKVDPQALSRLSNEQAGPGVGAGRFVRPAHLRERQATHRVPEPPLALAEMLFKSLPEDAKRDLRREGYDADNFFARLKKLPPTEIPDHRGR